MLRFTVSQLESYPVLLNALAERALENDIDLLRDALLAQIAECTSCGGEALLCRLAVVAGWILEAGGDLFT